MTNESLEWNEDMRIGVEAIDADHRALFYYAREFMEALERDEGALVFDEILESLVEYTLAHFRREETLMAVAGYPHLERHNAEHVALAHQVLEARNRYMLSPDKELDDHLRQFLLFWLSNHILKSDFDIRGWIAGNEPAIEQALKRLD